MNKGVMMQYKAVTEILFTVVGPSTKLNWTGVAVRETAIQKYLSIR